ncbi:MAG TPA: cyanophycin synthetase [Chitinophagaceae bacterium]|nr:cyanophycin synthetase [Chitinophagaceae bacterium]
MKIEGLKVMRGPNYWSNYRKNVIVMKLDIGELEQYPTNLIEGFLERLEQVLPSLYEHRCSEEKAGGFFERVRLGTWMGHVVEHIALELQTLAGIQVGYGRTRSTAQSGVYNVVFAYETEKAGKFAAGAAVRVAEHLISGTHTIEQVQAEVAEIKRLHARESLGPSTQSIVLEARKRNIPVTRLNDESMLMLGWGKNQKIIRASMTSTTSSIGVDIAADKERTKQILSKAHLPTPKGTLVLDEDELAEAIELIGFPVVVKPVDGNHGRGITTNITDLEAAVTAYKLARTVSRYVILERFVRGWDYRFLLVNFKLVAVAKRTPAMVIGNGVSTIQQLIDEVNEHPERGDGHEKFLTKIKVDEVTQKILDTKAYSLQTVLPFAEILFLKDTANISTGGTATDLTHLVHPANVFMAERIARLVNLDICGIDIIAEDINMPITEKTGAVIEVNAAPGFRMHLTPSKGIPRNIGESVVDMLYPDEANARIPLVAVTGTNGKTTTTRLIAHIAKTAGHNVGYTTTDGIYINNNLLCQGDCSGPSSAATILRDPIVDFAVLECARGGILRSGLGFDQSDISVVTNVTEDHIGIDGIESIEELARTKMVVPRTTNRNGLAILNADDELVYKMRKELDCNIALFSMNADNPRIKEHCDADGLAAFVEQDYIVVSKGKWKNRVAKVSDLPITFGGTAEFMIKNILPAVLVGVYRHFDIKLIADALKTFIPSVQSTPGRMNLFSFRFAELMVDYAHNEAGFIELKKYVDQHPAHYKIGVVAATGDRRDDDIRKIGYYAAQMFDEVIIRDDENPRGRSSEEMSALINEGVRQVNADMPVHIIPDEQEALTYALACAPIGSFILACADKVHQTIDYVSTLQKNELFPPRTVNELKQAS